MDASAETSAGDVFEEGPVLDREFEESLGYWIFTASYAIESALNEELAPLGITHRQVQILGALAAHGEASQAEIAEMLRIEPSGVVRLLDRMERAGWIRRDADPGDRRKKIVRPTEKVGPLWKQIKAHGMRARERGLRGITPEQVEATRDVLRQIRQNLMGDLSTPCPFARKDTSDAHGT
ncbi:MAG: MarR family transcriptional regulator [Planctomycetota bacterium]|nr:MarR family transcriptional regulator [Planctomycetaceae bacterium]MDQ3329351.1 MarR family transcriptional regulator [Planctomycetota bacterium]